ncbi:putative deoxyribonuclease [[Clostridium] sordellii]|uniref:CHC2 zinc finger domain-containing protein n=1 Tax=Paraclostridium sordellii TaxID=1505 RepID=UPI0005E13355|nr:CHC2 zinc finger domain-containing protein [Paeniclostridium sordellii]CEQ26526.1 putative deoxyribonuclease [[Clostridium] sordellii] [Paeniclostridium sordellii]
MKQVIQDIKSNPNILKDLLSFYGASQKKNKSTYSCVHCASSDALSINKKTNKYKCFSCGESGNAIDLVMNKEGLEFIGAIKHISNMYGIQLPKVEYTDQEKEEFIKIKEDKKSLDKLLYKLNSELKNKNIDINKKFEISCLIDHLKDKEVDNKDVEIINYSQYKATETIEVIKYISEIKSGLINCVASAIGGNINLLIAPTGSGKSYTMINTLKDLNIKALFILPNASNVQQAMVEYNIPGAYGNDLSPIRAMENGNIVAMTWDKTKQLKAVDLSEYIIVIDEIHQTFTDLYRSEAIKALYDITDRCKGRIDITATPNKLDFKIYDTITEYKQLEQTNYKVTTYNGIDTKLIIDILNKSNKSALLMNDKSTLKYISENINKANEVVKSDNKDDNKLYNNIMINSNMGEYETLLNTSVIVAGVNINEPNVTDIVIVGFKDIGTIKQYMARFRGLKEVNVHIFNTYKEECNIYSIEWLVKRNMQGFKSVVETLNNSIKPTNEFDLVASTVKAIKTDDNIYFDDIEGIYKVNDFTVRGNTYRNYYNDRTIENFNVLLGEYFDDIKTYGSVEEQLKEELKEHRAELKESKEMALDILSKHKDILVGYSDIAKGKTPTYELLEYHYTINVNVKDCLKQYKLLNIDSLIKDNGLKKTIDLYSKYVLENSFSINVAWELAIMSNRKRGTVFGKINTLLYRDLQEEAPHIINNELLENKLFRYITDKFKIGTSYTEEHLKVLADEIKKYFKLDYSTNKLSTILNQIYIIKTLKTKKGAPIGTIFYKNILPNSVHEGKQVRIYTIEKYISLEDIQALLNLEKGDQTIKHMMEKRKSKYKKQLTEQEQQVLQSLESVF